MKVTITTLTAITLTCVAAPAMGQRATKLQGTAPVFTSALPHNEQGMTIDPNGPSSVDLSLPTREFGLGLGRRPSGSGSLPMDPPRLTPLAIEAAVRTGHFSFAVPGNWQPMDSMTAALPAPTSVPTPGPAAVVLVAGCLLSRRRRC